VTVFRSATSGSAPTPNLIVGWPSERERRFAELPEETQVALARDWDATPDEAAAIFDGMSLENRWEVRCAMKGRTGEYAAKVARITEKADSTQAFERIIREAPPTQNGKAAMNNEEDGADLLDALRKTLTKYVVLPSAEATDAVVLWIAATHGLEAFEHATRLAIHSPIRRCGKSRLEEILEALVHSAIPTTNISVPALFRMIERASQPPTLILDEVDRLLGSAKKDEDNRELIAILNNGFRPGHPTYRCVGPSQTPTPFSNYAMVALAGIGRMPDTIEDRAINITMRRRLPGEPISKFRLRTDLPPLHVLRGRLSDWVASVMKELGDPVADIPDELEDRAQDAWEPMLAIADAAGGHWPERARTAAKKLTGDVVDNDDENLDVRILSDVRSIFEGQTGVTFVSSAELLTELRKLEESPWSDLDLTSRKLAYRLGKFGVKPDRNKAQTSRGYHLHDLGDAFHRYLPSKPSIPSRTPLDLGKSVDGCFRVDGLTRLPHLTRLPENPGQTPNRRVSTVQTDTPDGSDGASAEDDEIDAIAQACAPRRFHR